MQTEEKNHALEQAKSQASSIVEMVRALDRETAIEDFVETLSAEKCLAILKDAGIESDPENLETLREDVADDGIFLLRFIRWGETVSVLLGG